MNRSRARFLFLGLFAALGCQESEGIREYAAPRDVVVAAGPMAKKAAAVPTRILAAIIPRTEATWFVKLMGPATQLEKQGESFQQLVQSLKFDEPRKPTFTLPAGWARDDSNQARYSTLKLPAELGPLEATIIQLGPQAGSKLDNVNRWREQVGLSAITEAELPTTTKELDVAGAKVLFLDVTGPGGGKAGPMGMMAGGAASKQGKVGPFQGGARGAKEAAPDQSRESTPLAVKTPGGWVEVAPKPVTLKTYQAADGKVEITITQLGGTAGGMLPNINRWRNQIGLGPIDLSQSATELQPLETPSGKAIVVDFAGNGAGAKRITGAIVSQPNQTWFIKMMGPAEEVAKEKEAFLGLLKTLKLPQ